MQIVGMDLEDFRCLREVSFTCGRLTALVGANGTGNPRSSMRWSSSSTAVSWMTSTRSFFGQ
jgi:hypothetical protein